LPPWTPVVDDQLLCYLAGYVFSKILGDQCEREGESLSVFGVTPDPARVVHDGNVFTGGGVTAGIDMALTVIAEIAGPDFAQTVQLAIEYAPARSSWRTGRGVSLRSGKWQGAATAAAS
jgi:acyl-coenzyme A thioesterase PaaI-like protein